MDRWAVRETAAREAADQLVTTMPTPLWPMAETRIVRLLARGDTVREADLFRRLDTARTRVLTADQRNGSQARSQAVDQWSDELLALTEPDKCAVAALRNFSDTFAYLQRVITK